MYFTSLHNLFFFIILFSLQRLLIINCLFCFLWLTIPISLSFLSLHNIFLKKKTHCKQLESVSSEHLQHSFPDSMPQILNCYVSHRCSSVQYVAPIDGGCIHPNVSLSLLKLPKRPQSPGSHAKKLSLNLCFEPFPPQSVRG